MSNFKSYEEIEHTANLKIKKVNAERQKDLSTQNHINELEHIKQGYDSNGNKINCSYQERLEIMKKSSSDYINNYSEHQERLIDIENDIDDEEEFVITEKKPVKEKRTKKNRFMTGFIVASALFLGALSATCTTIYINHEKKIEDITEDYRNDLKELVDNCTVTTIGGCVYNNKGKIIGYVDTRETNGKNGIDIECSPIADYIMNSEDPDLALFTLYRNYGRVNKYKYLPGQTSLPQYEGICKKTFEHLDFDGKDVLKENNFIEYINLNNYKTIDEYYDACYNELLNNNDDKNDKQVLDNLRLTLKKGNN